MKLSKNQEEAKSKLLKWLETDESFFLFLGYAGTGKTFTLKHIINLPEVKYKYFVQGSAPTNKAVKVLRKSIPKSVTIHKLLGWEKVYHDDGTYSNGFDIEKVKKAEEIRKGKDKRELLLIIDEVSMLPFDICNMIKDYREVFTKIILVGDPAQLPPVDTKKENEKYYFDVEDGSMKSPFLHESFIKANANVFMTEVMRQKAGSLIAEYAYQLRSDINKDFRPAFFAPDSKEVFRIQTFDVFKKQFEKAKRLSDDYDYVKAITFQNSSTSLVNYFIREQLGEFKNGSMYYETGVYQSKGYYKNNIDKDVQGCAYTSDSVLIKEMKLKEVSSTTILPKDIELRRAYKLKYYKCLVDVEGFETSCYLLHEDSKKEFTNFCNAWKGRCKKEMDGQQWKMFYDFKDSFIKLASIHATNVNKAQGSTYNCVFLFINDFYTGDAIQTNRRLYTALTRASERVVIVMEDIKFSRGWITKEGFYIRLQLKPIQKEYIINKFNRKCIGCNEKINDIYNMESGKELEFDHIIPLATPANSKIWTKETEGNKEKNWLPLCKSCHDYKTYNLDKFLNKHQETINTIHNI